MTALEGLSNKQRQHVLALRNDVTKTKATQLLPNLVQNKQFLGNVSGKTPYHLYQRLRIVHLMSFSPPEWKDSKLFTSMGVKINERKNS